MNCDVYGVERVHNSDLFDSVQKTGRLKSIKDTCDRNNPIKFIRWLKKGKTVPYKHKYGYFFTSGPNTWHGMEKKEIKKERRCIQVNYVTFETDWKVES